MERLLKCRLCGGNVSSAASKCPHCGTPNFKPASMLRDEEALRAKNSKIERTRGYLSSTGYAYAPEAGHSDDEIRKYFPNSVKITFRVHVNSADKVCRYKVIDRCPCLDDDGNGLRFDSYHDGSSKSGDYIVNIGTHRVLVEVEIVKAVKNQYCPGQSNCDHQWFNVKVDRNTKYIIVEADSRREFLTGRVKLVNPSVRAI